MLTVRSAAKVPPESWPEAGWELEPISSKSTTKLPAPNWAAGRSIVVLGLTLFNWVPLTTRLLKADPAELKDELKAEACAVATARTTSAVTSPPTRLTPADSAMPVSVAVFVVGSTVLVLEALSTLAFRNCFCTPLTEKKRRPSSPAIEGAPLIEISFTTSSLGGALPVVQAQLLWSFSLEPWPKISSEIGRAHV